MTLASTSGTLASTSVTLVTTSVTLEKTSVSLEAYGIETKAIGEKIPLVNMAEQEWQGERSRLLQMTDILEKAYKMALAKN